MTGAQKVSERTDPGEKVPIGDGSGRGHCPGPDDDVLFSTLRLQQLDGPELVRQLWETDPSVRHLAEALGVGAIDGSGAVVTKQVTREHTEPVMTALAQCWWFEA